MSLQQEGPIRMPQPEQWMSEHPWVWEKWKPADLYGSQDGCYDDLVRAVEAAYPSESVDE